MNYLSLSELANKSGRAYSTVLETVRRLGVTTSAIPRTSTHGKGSIEGVSEQDAQVVFAYLDSMRRFAKRKKTAAVIKHEPEIANDPKVELTVTIRKLLRLCEVNGVDEITISKNNNGKLCAEFTQVTTKNVTVE